MSNIKAQSNDVLILQKYILDPLSSVIKLAVLGKKEIGCKISIKNNQIYIQDNGIFQGIARYYLGVTKNDIHYLSLPIELACKRYLTINKLKEITNITTIFISAQQGLKNLMETYSMFPIIVHCLKYYHSIIEKYLHSLSCEQLTNNEKKISLNIENITNVPKSLYNDKEATKPIKIPIKPTKNKESKSQSNSPSDYHTPINNEFLSDNFDTKPVEYKKMIRDEPNEVSIDTFKEISNDIVKEIHPDDLILSTNNNNSQENEKPDEIELSLLYTDDILMKFDLIWDKSKIQIVIDMINYLSGEKSANEYAGCIETFMIPIDKEIIRIIYENPNITSA